MQKPTERCSRLLLVFVLILISGCHAPSNKQAKQSTPLQEAVLDACHADVVFLGEEGSHGGGVALKMKGQMVQMLIEQCGFNHVVFESQIYDFEYLKHQYQSDTASIEALYDAIGGLWSTTAEIDPTVKYLHQKASSKEIHLSGMDGRIGSSTGLFTQKKLGRMIAKWIPDSEQLNCEQTITRLTSWGFNDQHPYDEAFKKRIKACADLALATVEQTDSPEASALTQIKSFATFIHSSNDNKERQELMTSNLHHLHNSGAQPKKTVVWTANIHATKKPFKSSHSVASALIANSSLNVKSIGVVGASGSYARIGQPITEFQQAPQSSLEAKALTNNSSIAYLSNTTLKQYDGASARLFSYSKSHQRAWSRLFDGILVFDKERPPNFVRTAKPMQAFDE